MKIQITILGREVELSIEEARRLHGQLSEIFSTEVKPEWPNLYPVIQPVIVPVERGPEPWWPNYPGINPGAPPYTICEVA